MVTGQSVRVCVVAQLAPPPAIHSLFFPDAQRRLVDRVGVAFQFFISILLFNI